MKLNIAPLISELEAERTRVCSALEALYAIAATMDVPKRRGRPPMGGPDDVYPPHVTKRGRPRKTKGNHHMQTAASRKAASKRMKKYWRNKKREAAGK